MALTINIKFLTKYVSGGMTMKTQAIQKINKIGKAGTILTMIGRILLIIGASCMLIGMIASAIFVPRGMVTLTLDGNATFQVDLSETGKTLPKDVQDDINSGVSSYDFGYIGTDGTSYDMTEIIATDAGFTASGNRPVTVFDMHDLSYKLIPVLVTIIAALVCMIFAGRLCKAFRDCETPFSENVIRCLQHLAFSLIPWTLLSSVADSTIRNLFSGDMSMVISLNLGMIVAVLFVFMLVAVFKYGAMLQQESDETL